LHITFQLEKLRKKYLVKEGAGETTILKWILQKHTEKLLYLDWLKLGPISSFHTDCGEISGATKCGVFMTD
jgi:hypothetical protein